MRKLRNQPTYTLMAEMMASPTMPTPEESRRHQLTRMLGGLANMERAESPTKDDWRVVSDAVNLMETLVVMGIVEDTSGLLLDAVEALALAGHRHIAGGNIRLDAKGIQAVRAVLEDYAAVLDAVSHRVMVKAHRLTEKRIKDILAGKRKTHDVTITSL